MSYKLDSPSAQRNKEAIWSVLETKVFAENKNELRVLEIAAGVGVHSHYFCQQLQAKQNFETIQWFPTDPREESRRSIEAYRTDVSEILQAPLALTLNEHGVVEDLQELEKKTFDLIVCINMIHISPWEATVGLMKAAQRLLKPGSGILYCYGPYKEGGTAVESNLKFEERLKDMDLNFGLRNLEDVVELAESSHLELQERIEMPANNLSVLYRRK